MAFRLIPAAALILILGACGGGGSGGSEVSNDGDNGEPAGPALESTQNYATGFALTEATLLLARYAVDAFARSEINEFRPLEVACDNQGTIMLEFLDDDRTGSPTPGDRLTLAFQNCLDNAPLNGTANGRIALEITAIQQLAQDRTVSYQMDFEELQISEPGLETSVAGRLFLTFDTSEDSEQIVAAVGDTPLSFDLGGTGFDLLADTELEKVVDLEGRTYSFSFNGAIEVDDSGNGSDFSMESVRDFRGFLGIVPRDGIARFTESDGTVECVLAAGADEQGVAPSEQTVLQLAPPGGICPGNVTNMPGLFWDQFLEGTLLDAPDPYGLRGENPPPPNQDDGLTRDAQTQVLALPGGGFDMALDAARGLIYISFPQSSEVAVVAQASLEVERIIATPGKPKGLDITANNADLLVALGGLGAIGVIDLSDFSVRQIDVSAALGSALTHDVVEARPGEVFVSAVDRSTEPSFIAKIDRRDSDAIMRVADGEDIVGSARFVAEPGGQRLLLRAGLIPPTLVELNLDEADAPIVRERRNIMPLDFFPNGDRFISPIGQVFRTNDLSQASRIVDSGVETGVVGRDGQFIHFTDDFQDQSAFGASVARITTLETEFYRPVSIANSECPTRGGIKSLQLRADGSVFFLLTGSALCEIQLLPPGEPNGGAPLITSISAPPDSADIGATLTELPVPAFDLAEDVPRSRIYASLPARNEIAVLSRDNLDVLEYLPVGPGPQGIALSGDGETLAVALDGATGIAFLDLNTGALDFRRLTEELGGPSAFDIVEASPGTFIVNPGRTGNIHLIEVERDASEARQIATTNSVRFDQARLEVDSEGDYLYAYTPFARVAQVTLTPPEPDFKQGALVDGLPLRLGLAIYPQGDRFVLSNGQVYAAADLSEVGRVARGLPAVDAAGATIFTSDFETTENGARGRPLLQRFDAVTLSAQDSFTHNCPITVQDNLQLRRDGQAFYILGLSEPSSDQRQALICRIPLP